MIRTLLAVTIAVGLLAVALPAVEDARVTRSDRLVRGELAALERAGNSLVRADETTPGPGARRTVELDLPRDTWGGAGVEYLALRAPEEAGGRSTVVYRLSGGRERRIHLDLALYAPDGPVRLEGGGVRRLALSLVRVDGEIAVAVRRVPG